MKVISKVDLKNKYRPKESVTITKRDVKGKITYKEILSDVFYCKKGDELIIIKSGCNCSKCEIGEWMVVVIVENKKGERFSIKWSDLDTNTDYNFYD